MFKNGFKNDPYKILCCHLQLLVKNFEFISCFYIKLIHLNNYYLNFFSLFS